jgi:MFS family permease
MTTAQPTPAASRTTPLWAVLSLTFLCSIGSGIVYGGVFFLAQSQYGFTQRDNFALALLYGVSYVPGAYFAGPLQRALRRCGITPRAILVGMMLVMGLLCYVPWVADRFAPASSERATWPIWLVMAVYSPVCGMMWPVVESFLAGGRTDRQLRAATGRFNIAWSSAVAITLFAMAGLVERHALLIIAILGCVHLGAIALVACFAAVPAAHEHHEHRRPVVYQQLLTFLRLLLPVSFMFNSTLSPYMPTALKALAVPLGWQTSVTATWYTTRVLTFLGMERWHGWHGRWATPICGALLTLVSFAAVVLVPLFMSDGLGLIVFMLGLAGFGIGVGIVYTAALYYAMEVGPSGVDAGGTHEALIGLGYTAGPICGLAGIGVAGGGSGQTATLVTLALVAAIALAVGLGAMVRAIHVARNP